MTMPTTFADRKICILGLGYVGLTLAVAMADSGFSVLGVEVRQDVLDLLAKGEPHFHEPRLKEKLRRGMRKETFTPVREIDPNFGASVYIITVGTPLDKNGQIELRFIEQASRQVAAALKDGDLVILRSTVKLGTARKIVQPILEATGRRFEIAVCPERTLEGQALLELHTLPQIIGSDDPDTRFRCAQLFSIMTPTTVNVSSLETAELVKLTDNTFRDVSFAFGNEIAKLCARLDVSAREVISAGRLGYPRTNVAWPGPVGGPCLEKDPHILAASARDYGVEMTITRAGRATNEGQPADAVHLIAKRAAMMGGFPAAPKIALLGLAFKGVPATDDLRGTMARPILDCLRERFSDARFVGYDPVVPAATAKAFFQIDIAEEVSDAVRDADLVVIANNHPSFRVMDMATLSRIMKRPAIVYDFWNLFDDVEDSMPEGVAYIGLGNEQARSDLPVSGAEQPVTAATVAAIPARHGDKRYLVTGGTGFIGSALVRRLVEQGHQVRVIDNDLRGQARRLDDLDGRFDLVKADVRDPAAVTEASRGCTSILHLAALNGTENFYNRPDLVLDVGVKGMFAVLEAARANSIRELVLASSSEAYQTPPVVPTPEQVPLTIDDPWNVRYSYGGSKIISEIMLGSYNRDLFERAMIFRPHNVYGPDMGFEHVLPQFVMRASERIEQYPKGRVRFEIQGDGRQTRSFIHIDDFIDGVMTILDKGQHREIYHIGTEEEHEIRDIVEMVFKYFGRDFELDHLPLPAGGTLRRCPSIAKMRSLGFAPKVALHDGIADLAEWYLRNKALWPRQREAAE